MSTDHTKFAANGAGGLILALSACGFSKFRELFERMTSPKRAEASALGRLSQWTQDMHDRAFGSGS